MVLQYTNKPVWRKWIARMSSKHEVGSSSLSSGEEFTVVLCTIVANKMHL